jgi:hypothetical protein
MLYRASSGYVQNWIELFGMMIGTYVFAVGHMALPILHDAGRNTLNY